MAVSRAAINSFARTFYQGGDTSTLWTPRPAKASLEQSTIVGVDVGNNVADIALNGSDEVAYGVRYAHFYGPDNPPAEGDLVLGHYDGRVMWLFARQVVPNGPVTLP